MNTETLAWLEVDPNDPPAIPCCYVIEECGRVLYVGQTERLSARLILNSHPMGPRILRGATKIRASVIRPRRTRVNMELALIKTLNPEFNILGFGTVKRDMPTIPVSPDIHRRVKVRSASEGKTLTDMADELLAFGLANKKSPKPAAK